ncbi:MAG: hypothetical protein JOZ46_08500 [Candidatus Dormibacteraeota bacterium]|nr:hypothetical protein [Candidatus Dormibacteraeota bacterium]MBV9525836.1 hypothetical protein [Candidatus Dormibacteraeota bacterium]
MSTSTQIGGNLLTNGLLVAVVALVHIQIAAFLIGASTMAIVSETVSLVRRNRDERHDRLAHGLIKSSIFIFGFGSALAIFFVMFVLTGVWGKFFVSLQQITFWVFFLEGITFLFEIVLIYTLYANWQRLGEHRKARLGMLILLNVVQWWQMFFIDIVASFMVTPNGGDVNILNLILNPTSIVLTAHRTLGNIAWAGAAVALVSGVQYLRVTRRLETVRRTAPATAAAASVGAMAASAAGSEPPEAREARYWDWAGQWGAVFAVGLTLLQPWVGYEYAKEIQLHAYPAWFNMMFGDLSNVFLVQITLLGSIFTLGAAYFWRRMKASGAPHARRQGVVTAMLAFVTLFAALPAWFAPTYADVVTAHLDRPFWQGGLLNPFGNFIPYKVGALFAMVMLALWSLTAYMRANSRDELQAGRVGRRSAVILIGLGATVSVMMMVMGVIREHARQPYLISGELTINNQQILNNQPSAVGGSSGVTDR